MADYIEPFDLYTILVNYFVGGQQFFAFAFIILFSFGCAKYQMENKIFLSLLAVSSLLLTAWLGEVYYFLTLFLIGFAVSKITSRIVI